jgi:predicted Fe-Mo cluster-binding NifX family protein
MRIAVPTNDRERVEAHFGHCREFAILECDGSEIRNCEYVTPPPHAPGVIPTFVAEQKASVIICGGMGQMAVNLFKKNNIEVILGAQGSIIDNLNRFLADDLVSTGSVCEHHHQHS